MSVYLKKFETTSAYEEYINGGGVVLPNISFCEEERGVHYNPYVPPHDYSQDYFTMVVATGGKVTWTGTSSNALSYSTDSGTTWSTPSSNITLPVNEGDKILWKGTTTPDTSGIGKFGGNTNVRYTVEGNVMSLLFGDEFKEHTSLEGKNYALRNLFNGNTNVTNAENLSLPATTLASNCYSSMFYGCIRLTTAPKLLATTLANGCYENMFYHCISLTTAPSVLPATTLTSNCYIGMFYECTNLTTAPELPATMLANNCYNSMFNGCESLNSIKCLATDISASNCTYNWINGVAASGTFTKAASMNDWPTGTSGIPNGWNIVDAA